MAKSKGVELTNKKGIKRVFTVAHALSVLQLEQKMKKQNWEITEKGYKFDGNDIIRTADKGSDSQA
jgi:hypothetical protein